ncbi:hypothetical protein BG004_000180 [Podila humilis]|nr:hypothetical protein BG004_000180 [Podila humilis]
MVAVPETLAQVTIPGYGTLQGAIDQERGIAIFRNVPYAKVPQRWRPAVNADPWTGIRDATKQGPVCPQNPSAYPLVKLSPPDVINVPGKPHSFGLDHDETHGLNMNIYVPLQALQQNSSESPLPVMAWVHGGAMRDGSNGVPLYDACNLVQHSIQLGQPTIVVAINYRLNVFGFIASKELLHDVQSSHAAPESRLAQSVGNWGLMDVQLAFRYIRSHIAVFGGNNKNVTAFGESAGSILIHYCLLSPVSHGLFDHAIMQSGTVATMPAGIVHQDGQPLFDQLLTKLDISLDLSSEEKIKRLRDVPMDTLTQAGEALMAAGGFKPYYDGYLVPSDKAIQQRALDASAYDPGLKSLMIGTTKDEGSAFTMLLGPKVDLTTWPAIVDRLVPVPALRPLFDKIYGIPSTDLEVFKVAGKVLTDSMFHYPTEVVTATLVERAKQQQHGEAGTGSFRLSRYHFDSPLAFMDTIVPGLGAMHAGELSFVFGPPMSEKIMTPQEMQLSREMQKLWLCFGNQKEYAISSNAVKGEALIMSAEHEIIVGDSVRLSDEAMLYWGKISGGLAARVAAALKTLEE